MTTSVQKGFGEVSTLTVPLSPTLTAAAEGLLRAVDEGAPAGALARELAVSVLGSMPSTAPAWQRALQVLEGGALRMRHAVKLAGEVLDAVVAEHEEQVFGRTE